MLRIFRSFFLGRLPILMALLLTATWGLSRLDSQPATEPATGRKGISGNSAGEGKRYLRIPVQEMIARVDHVLRIPEGKLGGRLSIITRAGKTAAWDFTLHRKTIETEGFGRTAALYQFSSPRRGLEAKILFLEDGEIIWLWDARRRLLYRKRDRERYERILGSGFTYQDLSGVNYQASYTGRGAVLYRQRDGSIFTRLDLAPINPGAYTRLLLLADHKNNFQPLRIDFHGRDRILFKTLFFKYGSILDSISGKKENPKLPVRLEVLDLKSGNISRLEYFSLDRKASPDVAFFDPDYLNR